MTEELIEDLEEISGGMIRRYNVKGLAPAVGAYRHVAAKRISEKACELEISGMLPLDPEGNVIGANDCKAQAKQVIVNIAKAITAASAHCGIMLSKDEALERITSTMVLLKDMGDFPKVNEAYAEEKMPLSCRAAFAVRDLPLSAKGVLLEIRANAYIECRDSD